MDRNIFADFCGASSLPVSPFRQDYTFAAVGAVHTGTQPAPSIENGMPAPKRER